MKSSIKSKRFFGQVRQRGTIAPRRPSARVVAWSSTSLVAGAAGSTRESPGEPSKSLGWAPGAPDLSASHLATHG